MPPKTTDLTVPSTDAIEPIENPDALDAAGFRHGLKPFERVLFAGLLAAESGLRDAKLLAEEWMKKLTDYGKSERS